MKKRLFVRWRANFFTGLALILPAVVSVALLVWVFSNIARVTDILLFFLPTRWTHEQGGAGDIRWYWSLCALVVAVLLTSVLGRLTRNYFGQRLLEFFDEFLLSVPMLNKVYGTAKQVNEAFTTSKKSSFKQVVLVEFPRAGQWAVGFVTNDQNEKIQPKSGEKVVSVFIPTTPNPTSGFLVLVPEATLTLLDLSVADGLKYIVSLGSLSPENKTPSAAAAGRTASK
ncbi:MAG: DUF502 domain-containing protein [Verrucomicrobia bacterium]|nr:DUF502 domain-containing protein [Verrucomicrobiota bacterium]